MKHKAVLPGNERGKNTIRALPFTQTSSDSCCGVTSSSVLPSARAPDKTIIICVAGHDRVDTRLKAGERRERFFADDDVSLDDLVARERKEGRQAKYDAHYADNISRNKRYAPPDKTIRASACLPECICKPAAPQRQHLCAFFLISRQVSTESLIVLSDNAVHWRMRAGLRRAMIRMTSTVRAALRTRNTRNVAHGRRGRTTTASSSGR